MNTAMATDPPPPLEEERELTIDEAVDVAVRLLMNRNVQYAADVFAKILAVAPNHPRALHFSGVLAHQQGQSDEALLRIERSLELESGIADWYSNYAIVLRDRGRLDEAINACRKALALDPNHANAHNNLGGLFRAEGMPAEAEAEYRAAIEINPKHSDAYTNLGTLLYSQKRTAEAVECLWRAVTLNPEESKSRRLLGVAYSALGLYDKAAEVYRQWAEEEPDNPVPRHMLAACTGQEVPDRAPDTYVERVFDSFAESFDTRLEGLAYKAPELIGRVVADSCPPPSKSLDFLDAGCGTGLCGPLIAPYAKRLVGVDLSGNMLALARQRGVYDELVKAELTAYLQGLTAPTFDAIVSADTLVYFGALEPVLTAAANALRPDGLLVCTVEELIERTAQPYRIMPHGRYAHSFDYVDGLLKSLGLQPDVGRAELRMESGVPVVGLVVRARKRTGGTNA
jgi:predicted TPR repeat methyltransferase